MQAVPTKSLARRNKSLSPERADAARAFVERLVNERFGGNVSAAAKAMSISQSLLYEFLNGTRGAGPKLLEAVADYAQVTIDHLIGRSAPSGEPVFESDDRYPNRAEAARFAKGKLPEEAIDAVLAEQLKSDEDKPALWWLEQMQRHADALEFRPTDKQMQAAVERSDARKAAASEAWAGRRRLGKASK